MQECKRLDESAAIELASSSSDEDQQPTTAEYGSRKRKQSRKKVINPEVAADLDRTLLSDRKAVYVLSAAASSFGHDV